MNDSELGQALRKFVAAHLAWHEQRDRAEGAAVISDVVEGYRVVDGGQVSSDGRWEITDHETKEVLASGVGRDSYDAAWQDNWAHIDAINDQVYVTERPAKPDVDDLTLPTELRDLLADWVSEHRDEAAALLLP